MIPHSAPLHHKATVCHHQTQSERRAAGTALEMPSLQEKIRHAMEIAGALGAMLPRPLSRPHLIAVFWTRAANAQHDSLRAECDGWHDIPAAQSAHVLSVGPGCWKMSQRNGLKDSSDSAANWQL